MSKSISVPKKEKETSVRDIFFNISTSYDLVNTILSGKSDYFWRKQAVTLSRFSKDNHILDCCAGTGEMAIQLISQKNCRVTMVDFVSSMLEKAKQKIENHGYTSLTTCVEANIRELPFPDKNFNGATLAFSLRNLPYLNDTLLEIKRVLIPGSKLVLLELTKPNNKILRYLYLLYLNTILPLIGGYISKNPHAYKYLAQSIMEFHEPEEFKTKLTRLGFYPIEIHPLTFGIATVFIAVKPL